MQVAEYRHGEKQARTATIFTIGQAQIIAASPWIRDMDIYTDEELQAYITFARKSPQALKAKDMLKASMEVAEAHELQQFEVLQAKKIQLVLKKRDALRKCQDNHGGPVTSTVELEAILRKTKCDEEKFKMLQLEIFYMRDNTYESCIMPDMSVFKARRKDDFGKLNPKPLEELKRNIIQLLEPDFRSTSSPTTPPEDDMILRLDTLQKKLTESNCVKNIVNDKTMLSKGQWVAVYWQEEDLSNIWYIGRISRIIPAGKCKPCAAAGIGRLNKDRSKPCYEIVYLSTKGARYEFADKQEYHTVAAAVLCRVTVLPSGRKQFSLTEPTPAVVDKLMLGNALCRAASSE